MVARCEPFRFSFVPKIVIYRSLTTDRGKYGQDGLIELSEYTFWLFLEKEPLRRCREKEKINFGAGEIILVEKSGREIENPFHHRSQQTFSKKTRSVRYTNTLSSENTRSSFTTPTCAQDVSRYYSAQQHR